MAKYKQPIDVTPYCYPGIFRIDSIKTKRSLFWEAANNVFFELRAFFDNVQEEDECDNFQFLEDFKEYGVSNFKIFILAAGPEYADAEFRKSVLEQCQKESSNKLYD